MEEMVALALYLCRETVGDGSGVERGDFEIPFVQSRNPAPMCLDDGMAMDERRNKTDFYFFIVCFNPNGFFICILWIFRAGNPVYQRAIFLLQFEIVLSLIMKKKIGDRGHRFERAVYLVRRL